MELTTEVTISPASPTSDYVFKDHIQRLIVAVLLGVITAVGVIGNTLVILAVVVSKRLQTRTNIFVLNLATADLLTCLVLPFQAVILLHDTLPFPDSFCTLLAVLLWLGIATSVVTLALIATLRFFIITRTRQRYMDVFRRKNVVMMIIGAWLFPFLLIYVPPLFNIGRLGYSTTFKLCTANAREPWPDTPDIYLIINGIALQCPCLIIIVVCYTKIYSFVKRSSLNLLILAREFPRNENTIRKAPRTAFEVAVFRRQVKVAKNLLIVTCSYIVCIMPYGVACIIAARTKPILPWTMVFLLFSCCVNPIIYALKHPQFREVIEWYLVWPFRSNPERQPLIHREANNRINNCS